MGNVFEQYTKDITKKTEKGLIYVRFDQRKTDDCKILDVLGTRRASELRAIFDGLVQDIASGKLVYAPKSK